MKNLHMLKLLKKIKKYFCMCTITSTLCQFIVPLGVYAVTGKSESKKIEIKKNKDIENLKKEKQNQNKNQKELESKISIITNEINKLLGEIKLLKNENKTKQENISNISNKILNTKNEIADIDFEIQNLTEETQELNSQLLKIMKIMYMENESGLLKNSFSANNFVEFDNNIKYSQKYSDYVKKTMQTYNEKIKEIDKNKNNRDKEIKKISSEQQEIEQSVEHNNEKSSQIEKLMQECIKKHDELKKHLNVTKIKTNITENAIKTLEKMDKKLTKKLDDPTEAINKAIAENNKKNNKQPAPAAPAEPPKTAPKNPAAPATNSKNHIYPVLGNSAISQRFRKGHPAIDIQTNGKANPVVASKAGTVVIATKGGKGNKMSGYGNVIVIDHGNGETTLYAHLSSFKVSAGQKVNQGQVIGNVGNTGNVSGRTGMHLHYEQKVGNNKVNPNFKK